MNNRQYLESIKQTVYENLKSLQHAPSVQMQDVPPDFYQLDEKGELDPDSRNLQDDEKRIEHPGEFYDGERDQDKETESTIIG